MEVLLLKDVPSLGKAGEIHKVNDGYARNYLFPHNLASQATPGAVKQAELHQKAQARRKAKALSEAQALAAQIGQEVDKRKIIMDEPLKELGTHAVTIRLAAEAEAKITVVVEREE